MCGIAGILRWDAPATASADRLREMQRRLRHRGPDGEGTHVGSQAALAHTRLAVLDLAGGAQPMTTPDGRYTLVYNGEVYNHRELRGELDYPFRTRSDAEVVLAAFVRWGEACLPRLNGMFAFFVWDERERRGFAARDRLGIKPFVFRRSAEEFAFASEAKALVGDRPRPDVDSVLEYLVAPYFSGVAHSMFEGIEPLPAGHWLEVDPNGVRVRKWWEYRVREEQVSATELRDRLRLAVRRSLEADVPIGTYLSGGLDSTLITALARPRHSFTVRFEGQDRYDYARSTIVTSDDTEYAKLAAAELGVPFRLVPVDRSELLRVLPEMCAINDAIPAWEQEFAQYFLAREASHHVKAVLVGDAADETHYGYHFLLGKTPQEISALFGRERRLSLLRPEWHDRVPSYDCLETNRLILDRWLGRLLHNGDIHAMAWGLEARVPFGDTELLDLAGRVGISQGVRGGVEKALLREAVSGWIPDAIRLRKKSALPKDPGMEAGYQQATLRIMEERGEFLGRFLDPAAVRALCARPLDEMERAILFNVLSLAHWSTRYGMI